MYHRRIKWWENIITHGKILRQFSPRIFPFPPPRIEKSFSLCISAVSAGSLFPALVECGRVGSSGAKGDGRRLSLSPSHPTYPFTPPKTFPRHFHSFPGTPPAPQVIKPRSDTLLTSVRLQTHSRTRSLMELSFAILQFKFLNYPLQNVNKQNLKSRASSAALWKKVPLP